MSSRGMADYMDKTAELIALGVNSVSDICLARVPSPGFKQLSGFKIQNVGRGNVVVTVKKRGQVTTVNDENINALRVGATNRYRNRLANRRIVPGSVVIVDSNVGTPQQVEDTNGDGILYQTNGPAGPTYPVQVGTIEYNEGILDFTFEINITENILADYKETDWNGFTAAVEFDPLRAGGASREYIILPDNADNWADGIKDEVEVGFFAKLEDANQENTMLRIEVNYFGDDSQIQLPILKGEIGDFPYHNA